MKYTVTYHRNGKPRRFRFDTLPEASAYCARVHRKTGVIAGITLE